MCFISVYIRQEILFLLDLEHLGTVFNHFYINHIIYSGQKDPF